MVNSNIEMRKKFLLRKKNVNKCFRNGQNFCRAKWFLFSKNRFKSIVDIYNNVILFAFDKLLHFVEIVIGFDPVAVHDVLSEFCGRCMFQNAARLFNQMISGFAKDQRKNQDANI